MSRALENMRQIIETFDVIEYLKTDPGATQTRFTIMELDGYSPSVEDFQYLAQGRYMLHDSVGSVVLAWIELDARTDLGIGIRCDEGLSTVAILTRSQWLWEDQLARSERAWKLEFLASVGL